MKYTIIALLALVLCSAIATQTKYEEFKAKYRSVTYGQLQYSQDSLQTMFDEFLVIFKNEQPSEVDDYQRRSTIFGLNLAMIVAHNIDSTKSWKMGINEYTDMTEDEFFNHFRFADNADQKCSATSSEPLRFDGDLPTHVDWRESGKVTPVKNQGSCGSCWTFSTVGSMEAHALISSGETSGPNFSEQQLVDCADASTYDCHGCAGGLPSYAFNYIRDHGMTTEETYPYHAVDETCYFDKSMTTVTTTGPHNITAGDEDELHSALANAGPVSIAFQVVGDFRNYESGVYTSTECDNGPMDVNHAVLAVGYGHNTTSDLPYYTIKNSWGDSWGNQGYFDMESGVNMCGVAVCNSFPLNVSWTKKSAIKSFMTPQ